MKTIKSSFSQTGTALYIRALLLGTLSGVATIALLLCIATGVLMISGTLPQKYLVWIAIALCGVATLISGYITSRIIKSNGMLTGAISGIIMFLILLFAGFAGSEETLTYITLIKLFAFVICGALGGIKGVNKKEKIRIK
ncbi:MAG: TIGR04086 family membrane protein [Clostridia bacterium]|nr:TIGR04086 family membrane protein [Clostridia bacterium]